MVTVDCIITLNLYLVVVLFFIMELSCKEKKKISVGNNVIKFRLYPMKVFHNVNG